MTQEPLLPETTAEETVRTEQFEGRIVSPGQGKCTLILHPSGDISLHQVRTLAHEASVHALFRSLVLNVLPHLAGPQNEIPVGL